MYCVARTRMGADAKMVFVVRNYSPRFWPSEVRKLQTSPTGLEAHKAGRAPAGPQAASPTRLRLVAPGPASPSKKADLPSHNILTYLGRLALDSCSSKAGRTQSLSASHRRGLFLEGESTRGLDRVSLASDPTSPAPNSQPAFAISK